MGFIFMGALLAQSVRSQSFLETELRHPPSNINIRLVFTPALAPRIPLLQALAAEGLRTAEAKLGVALRDDATIFFDSEPDDHNGLATVVPTNRIFVQTEAPSIEESIGFSQDYLRETLTHEFSHLIVVQARRGVFDALDTVFGTASRPVGLWPRWMHEGLAVWTEGVYGGRVRSGVIELDLRKYSEYMTRLGDHPLRNSDLDGTDSNSGLRAEKVRPGQLPYHFGYLLLDEWARARPEKTPFKPLLEEASRSLGLSFRPLFRKLGPPLDETFEKARTRWASTRYEVEDKEPAAPLAQAEQILGPFASDTGVHWIEFTENAQPRYRLKSLDGDEIVELKWNRERTVPEEAYRLATGEWLVLVRGPQKKLGLPYLRSWRVVNEAGRDLCRVPAAERVREAALRGNTLLWVRGEENGNEVLERSVLATACRWEAPVEVTRSREPFERLSTPAWSGDAPLYSRSEGRNSYREFLELPEGRLSAEDMALSRPQLLARTKCPDSPEVCYLAHAHSPTYWGPLLVTRNRNQWLTRRLVLNTGSTRSAVAPAGDRVLVREELWDKDVLRWKSFADFNRVGPKVTLRARPARETPNASPAAALGGVTAAPVPQVYEYSAMRTLGPQFWMPTFAAVPGGFLAMGSTFFEDVTRRWNGSLDVGYDSFLVRPFAQMSLGRTRFTDGSPERIRGELYYAPAYNAFATRRADYAQDRWGAATEARWRFLSGAEWNLDLYTTLEFLKIYRADPIAAATGVIPGVGWALRSPKPPSANRLSVEKLKRWSFELREEAGVAKSPFLYTSLRAGGPVSAVSTLLDLESGISHPRNYPLQGFEWGGLPGLATRGRRFLSRGFAARNFPASSALRGAAESIIPLASPAWRLSWNRARLDSLHLRTVAESVSVEEAVWPATRARRELGKNWNTSLGGALELNGSVLHYANFSASLGVFRGLGSRGDTRGVLWIQSWLDL